MGSPLTRPGSLARLAVQQDSRDVDYGAVARSIDADKLAYENRQRKFKEERRQEAIAKQRDYRFAMLKAQNQKGLMINSNSGYESVDDYFNTAGRKLADEGSNLVDLFSKGEIDSNQFAASYAKLSNQVDQLTPFASGIQTMMQTYQTDLAQGNLSAANKASYEGLYQAISENKGELSMDDNGVLVYAGKTAPDSDGNTEPFSIPINQFQKIPQPIKKVENWDAAVRDVTTLLSTPKESFNPATGRTTVQSPTPNLNNTDYNSGIRGAFDDFLGANGNNNALRSLAVDHSGIPLEEAEAMLESGPYEPTQNDFSPDEIALGFDKLIGERFSSKLEFEMERQFIKKGMEQSQVKHLQSKMQNDIDYRNKLLEANREKAILAAQTQQVKAQSSGTGKERALVKAIQVTKNRILDLGENIDFSNPQTLQRINSGTTSGGVEFEFDDGKLIALGGGFDSENKEIKNMLDFYDAFAAGNNITLNDLGIKPEYEGKLFLTPINFNKK